MNSDLILPVVLQKNAVHTEIVTQNCEFNGGILTIYKPSVCMCLRVRAVNPHLHTSKKNDTRCKTGSSQPHIAIGYLGC